MFPQFPRWEPTTPGDQCFVLVTEQRRGLEDLWLPSPADQFPSMKEPSLRAIMVLGALGKLRQGHSGSWPARAKQHRWKEAKTKMKANHKQKDPKSVVVGNMLPVAGVIISILVLNTFSPEIERKDSLFYGCGNRTVDGNPGKKLAKWSLMTTLESRALEDIHICPDSSGQSEVS